MSMSALVTTMSRQDGHQDEQQKELTEKHKKVVIRSRVHT